MASLCSSARRPLPLRFIRTGTMAKATAAIPREEEGLGTNRGSLPRPLVDDREPDSPSTSALSDRVNQLIDRIKPTKKSLQRRARVAAYVRTLIKTCFAPEVQVDAFQFGSVPLKTYLPDGDIDFSVFLLQPPPPGINIKDTWATKFAAFLEAEQRNPRAHLEVRGVNVIHAEVKLLKCLVDNIVVDISFNQLGGLCTLNFLECVDRKIGRDHLFKRSVVLVKAWCYYESRLLGAHHALISTYALETLVLYIFNAYHAELTTPLSALQKFLDGFSGFDWDTYAASLEGRIPLSDLPNPKTVLPYGVTQEQLLLDKDFVQEMLKAYGHGTPPESGHISTVPSQGFTAKYLNICDVLMPSNNLGRSVSRASFSRVRKAFAFGARALHGVLKSGSVEELDRFFRNTWNAQRTHKEHAYRVAGGQQMPQNDTQMRQAAIAAVYAAAMARQGIPNSLPNLSFAGGFGQPPLDVSQPVVPAGPPDVAGLAVSAGVPPPMVAAAAAPAPAVGIVAAPPPPPPPRKSSPRGAAPVRGGEQSNWPQHAMAPSAPPQPWPMAEAGPLPPTAARQPPWSAPASPAPLGHRTEWRSSADGVLSQEACASQAPPPPPGARALSPNTQRDATGPSPAVVEEGRQAGDPSRPHDAHAAYLCQATGRMAPVAAPALHAPGSAPSQPYFHFPLMMQQMGFQTGMTLPINMELLAGTTPPTPHPSHLPPAPPAAHYLQHSPQGGRQSWIEFCANADSLLRLPEDLFSGELEALTRQLNSARRGTSPTARLVDLPVSLLTEPEVLLSRLSPSPADVPMWPNSSLPRPGMVLPPYDMAVQAQHRAKHPVPPAVMAQPVPTAPTNSAPPVAQPSQPEISQSSGNSSRTNLASPAPPSSDSKATAEATASAVAAKEPNGSSEPLAARPEGSAADQPRSSDTPPEPMPKPQQTKSQNIFQTTEGAEASHSVASELRRSNSVPDSLEASAGQGPDPLGSFAKESKGPANPEKVAAEAPAQPKAADVSNKGNGSSIGTGSWGVKGSHSNFSLADEDFPTLGNKPVTVAPVLPTNKPLFGAIAAAPPRPREPDAPPTQPAAAAASGAMGAGAGTGGVTASGGSSSGHTGVSSKGRAPWGRPAHSSTNGSDGNWREDKQNSLQNSLQGKSQHGGKGRHGGQGH